MFVGLNVIGNECASIALAQSAKCAQRIIKDLEGRGMGMAETKFKLEGLQSLIYSEMEDSLFLSVRPSVANYYNSPSRFDIEGVSVSETFPAVIRDIESAGNCLVSELGTAAVFHCMRIMEAGLKELAKPLGIPYAPSWESYLKQIHKQLDRDWKDKPPEWKKDEVFFKEAAAHLSAVRVAWRNPTMHIVRSYDSREAEEIFISVRSFMQHLASMLKA